VCVCIVQVYKTVDTKRARKRAALITPEPLGRVRCRFLYMGKRYIFLFCRPYCTATVLCLVLIIVQCAYCKHFRCEIFLFPILRITTVNTQLYIYILYDIMMYVYNLLRVYR